MSGAGAARPSAAALPWYLASSSLWLAAMTLQTFLVQWLLVFHLHADAMQLGASRALMDIPPLAMLLIGGVLADRSDGRRLLAGLSLAACLPPLAMLAAIGHLGYAAILGFGIVMALLQTASDPARAAMLNRITRIDIQRTVTLATLVTTLVAMAAYWLGGRLETLGLAAVLGIQSALFAAAAAAASRLPPLPPPPRGMAPPVRDGLRALWKLPPVRDILAMNFASSMFNAGAYAIVAPLLVREVYAGDAAFLSALFIAFTIGSTGANALLLAFMPLRRPGRVFLRMQLVRIAILAALWCAPPPWLFLALIGAWGVVMGVTSTLVRTTVQEQAPPPHRAKILAALIASFMVASPASALILGFAVEFTSAATGLLPGIAISLAIFAFGRWKSDLWRYESSDSARPWA